MLRLEECAATGIMLTKGNCLLYRFVTGSTLQCFGRGLGTDGSSVSSCGWEDPIRDDWAGLTFGSGSRIEKSHRSPIGSSLILSRLFSSLSFSIPKSKKKMLSAILHHCYIIHTIQFEALTNVFSHCNCERFLFVVGNKKKDEDNKVKAFDFV